MDGFRETVRRWLARARAYRLTPRQRRVAAVAAIAAGVLLALGAAAVAVAHTQLAAIRNLCTLDGARAPAIGKTSFVYAADGSLLGAIPAEIARQPVQLGAVSPWLVRAPIAIEYRRFFRHHGMARRR